jgi:putative spermidine/putrescine transport system ATP-binding protein
VYRGGRQVAVSGMALNVDVIPAGIASGSEVTISIRPEDISVMAGAQAGENMLPGTVTFVRDVGSSVEVYLDCNGIQIISQSTPKSRPAVRQRDTATAVLPPAACVVLTA